MAWQSNLEKIGKLEAAFEQVLEINSDRPTGSDSTKKVISQVRFSTHENKVVIRKQKFSDSRRSPEYYFDGKTWTEHRQDQGVVIIRRQNQMPGAYPFDFREAFMHDLRSPFLECISRIRFMSKLDRDKSLIMGTFNDKDHTILSINFDPKFAMLPTESVHARNDGNPLRKVEMQYEYIQKRDAYLPSIVIEKLFGAPDYSSPNSVMSLRLKSVELDESKADLVFEYPVNSRIYNMAPGEMDEYRKKKNIDLIQPVEDARR